MHAGNIQPTWIVFTIDNWGDKLGVRIDLTPRTRVSVMLVSIVVLGSLIVGQTDLEQAHARNPVFVQLVGEGWNVKERRVRFPEPLLRDGDGAEASRKRLEELAKGGRAVDELLRDSVTAPFILRVHDLKLKEEIVRQADLWFVVRGEFADLDPERQAQEADGKQVEAANMVFESRLVRPAGLADSSAGATTSGVRSWYVHVRSRLLDRIEIEATNHVVVTQSSKSIVIGSVTEPRLEAPNASGWRSVSKGGQPAVGLKPYAGGASYTKISKLAGIPGANLVEMHLAFLEPDAWFQGAPILRSKISVAAQDQIRRLRRELERINGRRGSRAGASSGDKPPG